MSIVRGDGVAADGVAMDPPTGNVAPTTKVRHTAVAPSKSAARA
jgi:hypothetical protein